MWANGLIQALNLNSCELVELYLRWMMSVRNWTCLPLFVTGSSSRQGSWPQYPWSSRKLGLGSCQCLCPNSAPSACYSDSPLILIVIRFTLQVMQTPVKLCIAVCKSINETIKTEEDFHSTLCAQCFRMVLPFLVLHVLKTTPFVTHLISIPFRFRVITKLMHSVRRATRGSVLSFGNLGIIVNHSLGVSLFTRGYHHTASDSA
jgi:hypothetical protein